MVGRIPAQVGLTQARAAIIAPMSADAQSLTANEAFFAPIAGLAEASTHTVPLTPTPLVAQSIQGNAP